MERSRFLFIVSGLFLLVVLSLGLVFFLVPDSVPRGLFGLVTVPEQSDDSVTESGNCTLVGDNPPCGTVALSEIVSLINQWAGGHASLSDVIKLINAWTNPSSTTSTRTTTTTSSTTSSTSTTSTTLPYLSISLSAPANNTNTTQRNLSFNYTVVGSNGTYNCSLFLNRTLYNTSRRTLNNTLSKLNVTNLGYGTWWWNITCNTNSTMSNTSQTRTITIRTTTTTTTTSTTTTTVPVDCYGAVDCNPSGDPIGGGAGYSDIITETDSRVTYVVSTKEQLLSALSNATSGDVVFVKGTANINMDGTHFHIPAGVTLASDRGNAGSLGARLYATVHTAEATYPIQIHGNNTRITGLRIEGDYGGADRVGPDGNGYQQRSGIYIGSMYGNYTGLEVDNCEIYNWSAEGVAVYWNSEKDSGRINANVHNNYIHHVQSNGLGYGVGTYGGHTLITANLFDWTRHAISGHGMKNETYVAKYNIYLGGTSYITNPIYNSTLAKHGQFDVHGYPHHPGDAWQSSDQYIGNYTVQYNTFLNFKNFALVVRAKNYDGTGIYFDHNIIEEAATHSIPPVGQRAVGDYGTIYMSNNKIGKAGATPVLVAGDDVYYWQGHPSADLPDALFNATPMSGAAPLTVVFTDRSTGSTINKTHAWDFNNDAVIDSTIASPTHTYSTLGNYTVRHVVTNLNGSHTFTRTIVVW
jgi:PKD repeat protein